MTRNAIPAIVALALVTNVVALRTEFACGQEEEPSAFIDPFNPAKADQVRASEAENGKGSFFPKLPAPSMPKLPNLNPFSKRKSPSPLRAASNKPNFFQQIGTGTKNFFTRTTHTLMPWTRPKPKPAEGAIIPAFMQNNRTAEKKKSGIQLMNFFAPDPPENRIETTGDFFRQERPGFRK